MTNDRTDHSVNQAVLEQAGQLPRAVTPDRDLWPGIAGRLGEQLPAEEATANPAVVTPIHSQRLLPERWQAPALAASLLVALLLGYWIGREGTDAPSSAPMVAETAPGTGELRPVSLVEEVGLLEARNAMAAEIEAGLDRLPADARIVVIDNLTAINKALDQIDAVLEQAPATGLDRQLLISMYTDQLARLSSVQALVMNSNQEILL